LRGWPQADLLTNSIVHVLVNADGNVLSEVLLVSSGLREADEEALRLAGAAQFTPLPHDPETHRPVSRLAWGTLVFEWQTLPPGDDQPATKP
jgi:TonB family protein